MDQAAERIDGDKPKISRLESGQLIARRLEIEALLELYGVTDPDVVSAMVTLARESRQKGWWHQFTQQLRPDFQERIDLENEAVRIQIYQPLLVPGLLQTPEYAETTIRAVDRLAPQEQIEAYIAARLARQEILRREKPPQFVCVLDEAVLHRRVGGAEVIAPQLSRLLEVNSPPELSIQVVPFGQGWHAGLDGPFTVYSYPDPLDLDVVTVEYLDGTLHLEEDQVVEKYRMAFDQLRSSALSSGQSMELISRLARDEGS
jgi:hypothetical protein